MSDFDKPINYKRDVKMNYDESLADDIDYINFKDKLVKKIDSKNTYNESVRQINQLFSPNSFISDKIDYNEQNNIKLNEFDPYINYINTKGLNQKNIKVRYNVEYLNIDSRNRNYNPKSIISNAYRLNNNPLSISNNQLIIAVSPTIINNLTLNSKISLSNVPLYQKSYLAFGDTNYLNANVLNPINNSNPTTEPLFIQFFSGKSYAQINVNPNIYFNNTNLSDIDFSELFKNFDTSKTTVSISGLKGVRLLKTYENTNTIIKYNTPIQLTAVNTIINDINQPYIGNIPISYLNQTLQIYITPPGEINIIPNINKFYILLPWASDGTNIDTTTENYNITLTFNHYNLIPINEINTDFPINSEHIYGYHVVNSINSYENYITCTIYPPIDLSYINSTNFSYPSFAGNNIHLNIIENILYGYPYPNNYTIQFNKIYNNIIQIKLIDTMIINPSITFINSGNGKNNRLYFQNIEDIEEIQYIELKEGYYNITSLKNAIETEFSLLKRNILTTNFGYDLKYNVIFNVDTSTNITILESYKSKTLQIPITTIYPSVSQDDSSIGTGTYTISILHPNHCISSPNTFGIFSGFVDHLGIPASNLNGKHNISVIDVNRYSFTITNVNLTQSKVITNGGYNVLVLIPSPMKLYFNYSDTMGNVLGYRNPGNGTSITNYNYIQKNTDIYIGEINKDVNGNEIILTNNNLQLKKYDYFLMMCNIPHTININNLTNTQTKEIYFAKFKITDDNSISNEFSETPIFFYDPLVSLNNIGFTFYYPDKTLVDFKNREHSFILEITTIDNLPELTAINPNVSVKM
jgi:hypothetical protein